jgi:hypothetical protein
MKRHLKLFTTTLSALVATAGLALPSMAAANSMPRVYTQPAQFSASNGGNVSVPVRVDPGGSDIDTVEVKVAFPESQLTFVSVDKAGSAFDTFVPGAPKASKGTLEFSAASLGKSVSDDTLVGTLVFSAKATTGAATLNLTGSAVARAGAELETNADNAVVAFSANGVLANKLSITDISVTDVTVNGATVRWKTATPSTSSVDYGASAQYGLSAGSEQLTTDHVVKLASVFGGHALVHFAVTSRDASGSTGTSDDNSFTTAGYTISVTVKDKAGKALSGADVRVGDGAKVKADSNGVATVSNVAPGNQKVVVNGGKAQFISVKALRAAKAADVQKFSLTAEPNPLLPRLLLGLFVVLVTTGLVVWLWRERATKATNPQ